MSDSTSINALIAGQHNASVIDSLANPPQVNVLGSVTRAADAAKTVMGVRTLQAHQAWNDALAAATDKTTGGIDFPAALKAFSGTPAATYGMQEAATDASGLQNDQLKRAGFKSSELNSTLGALLSKPDLSFADVRAAGDDLVKRQIFSPGEMNADLSVMPQDPAALRQHLQQLQLRALAVGDQINRQQTLGMSPENYYGLVTVELGNDQRIQVPKGQAGLILSVNPELRRLNPTLGGSQGPVTNDSFGPNAGRKPSTSATPTSTPAPAASAWTLPPPPLTTGGTAGGVGVTAAPGYVDAQKSTAAASTQALTTLQTQLGATKDVYPILDDMEAQLGTKGFTPGFGLTTMNSVRQLMQRAGLVAEEPGPGVNLADPQAAAELFAKNAARLQATQMAALGNPTDARQELSESTNPGMLLSKYGNLGIIHMLRGNQQAIEAMGGAWAQAKANGWTPDRYNEWMNERFLSPDKATGGRFDPRAFWFANEGLLDAQKAYFAKIPEKQRQQFLNNLQYAKNSGWITQGKDGSAQIAGGAGR